MRVDGEKALRVNARGSVNSADLGGSSKYFAEIAKD